MGGGGGRRLSPLVTPSSRAGRLGSERHRLLPVVGKVHETLRSAGARRDWGRLGVGTGTGTGGGGRGRERESRRATATVGSEAQRKGDGWRLAQVPPALPRQSSQRPARTRPPPLGGGR
nr:unnamed protein product [Digitaria exilis]